jgi:hypothetical protein
MMRSETVNLNTRSRSYDSVPTKESNRSNVGKYSISTSYIPAPQGSLTIEKPSFDSLLRPPKSTIRKVVFNPNAWAAQNYNIVEDLAKAPCAMSTL